MEMNFKVDRLKEGMILSNSVKNPKNNTILLPAGATLTGKAIEVFKKLNITDVDIELSQSEVDAYNNPNALFLLEIDNGITPTISKKRTQEFKKAITPLRKGREDYLNVQDVITAAAGLQMDITAPNNNPLTKGKLSYRLNDYQTDVNVTDSAIRIATYATMVANAYNRRGGIPRDKYINENEIALAALLHNYGAICKYDEIRHNITIPKLIKYFPALTEKACSKIIEKFDARFIPIYSYTLLKDKAELFESSVIKKMIINARENRKFTGPLKSNQLVGDSRSVMGSLIISLCAMYDEVLMSSIRSNSGIEQADEALMNAYYGDLYDRDLIELFRECIPLYPVGTKIMIYNEDTDEKEYAVVINNSLRKENYRNPVVLTVPGNETIDLSKKYRSRVVELVSDTVEYATMNLKTANNTKLTGRR